MMGVFPIGTLVALTTGEIGIVRDLNPETRYLLRPTVKIVADADGHKIDGEIVDLAAEDPDDGPLPADDRHGPRPGQVRHRGRRLLPGRSRSRDRRGDRTPMAPRPPLRLRCEYRDEPLGVDTASPRLSWLVESGVRGERPTAWHLLVSSALELLRSDVGDLWDTGQVDAAAGRPGALEYAGEPLLSCARYHWKVRWWDRRGPSQSLERAGVLRHRFPAIPANGSRAGSPPARSREFRSKGTVLLSAHQGADDTQACAVYLRKEFDLEERVALAMIFVSGLGHYELRLNGEKVGTSASSTPAGRITGRRPSTPRTT
ncbi:MAG: hypothetical protein M0C28_38830 [Candidatus Moduliflexus flocculans]|nr:hypothetical protein [Candidatus Moduliflexus flocculans]